jgi:uncharacterized protein DUF3313
MRPLAQSILLPAALALICTFNADGKPRLQTGPDAEITHDGLHRVDRSAMDAAWVKPDLDLRPYTKLMLKGAEVQYRAVDSKGNYYRAGADDDTTFAISEEGKQMLVDIVGEQFREELAKSERYELVTTPGPRTLLLYGTLIDVVSNVPPLDQPGRYDVYLSQVGEATLVFELRDAVTNEVLARAADRRAAEQQGFAVPANAVNSWSVVRQLARSWAIQLRKRLDEVTVVGQ